jgi:hypothetical protein
MNEGISGTNDQPATAPATPLAGKFDGYKYGRAPFKQCTENIMVFRKPPLNSTVIADLMELEDNLDHPTISPAVVWIDGGRVATSEGVLCHGRTKTFGSESGDYDGNGRQYQSQGRIPPTVLCDSQAAEVIDRQSGVLTSGNHKPYLNKFDYNVTFNTCKINTFTNNGDTGGAARILHKCDYEDHDHDIYLYCPKVAASERNKGLEGFSDIQVEYGTEDVGTTRGTYTDSKKPVKCNHPTLKPINLIFQIARLFKLPDEANQKVLIPFAGVCSEYIGFLKAGFREEQLTAIEISQEYTTIGKARVEYWARHFKELAKIQTLDF